MHSSNGKKLLDTIDILKWGFKNTIFRR